MGYSVHRLCSMCDNTTNYNACSYIIEIWRAVQHHVNANPYNTLTVDAHILPYLPRSVQVDIVALQVCLRSLTTSYTMQPVHATSQNLIDKTWNHIVVSSMNLVSCLNSYCNLSNKDSALAIHESTFYHNETKHLKNSKWPTIACIAKDDRNVCFVLQYYNGNVSMVNLEYDYRQNMRLPCVEPIKDIMMV